jgi:hypothetical protein
MGSPGPSATGARENRRRSPGACAAQDERIAPPAWSAEVMVRLAAPLVRAVLRRQFAGYCDNLKRVLESGSR